MLGTETTTASADSASNYERVRSLQHDVDDALSEPSEGYGPDFERKRAVTEWLERHDDIRSLARRAEQIEYFALAYIQREQTRFRTPPGEHPYEGRRTDPLCMCQPSNCPLKRGQLPDVVEQADTIAEGSHQFRASHQGEPVVLTELNRLVAEVMTALENVYREAVIILNGDGEPRDERIEVSDTVQRTLEVL